MNTPRLTLGSLAYLDTINGDLVPCKVIAVQEDTRQDGKPVPFVIARITATRGKFNRGGTVTSEGPGRIVPRDAVKFRRGQDRPDIRPFVISAAETINGLTVGFQVELTANCKVRGVIERICCDNRFMVVRTSEKVFRTLAASWLPVNLQ